jgi:hypothetical protein
MNKHIAINAPIAPLYFVEVDYGRSSRVFMETNRDTNSRQSVVQDIADGQYDRGKVIRVLEIFEDEGTCRDVTEDIANEVTQLIYRRGSEWPVYLEDFLREHSGVVA